MCENMRGTFHLTAHPETETLVLSGDSSNHGHGADAERLAELYGLFFDLLRQLTGRRQDDSVGTLVRVFDPARDGRHMCVRQVSGGRATDMCVCVFQRMLRRGGSVGFHGVTCQSWAGW